MKTLVIYTSQTGFTQRYAQWIAGRTNGDLMELKEAGKQEDGFFAAYDAIVYGGWFMGGKIVRLNWFLEKAADWKDKRLAAYCADVLETEPPQADNVLLLSERAFITPHVAWASLEARKRLLCFSDVG